jgi:glycosyltransferase involved in cell wall biosynthesis
VAQPNLTLVPEPVHEQRVPVSVVVLTYNERLNIDRCLQSVAGWCAELHIVDSGSTDGTLDIARHYTQLVHYHEYVDHATQLTWILENLPVRTDWILFLDADNEVSALLRRHIAAVLANPDPDVNGYYSPHRFFYRGKRIRGFKPWSIRLVRRSMTMVDDSELVDFRLVVRGDTGFIKGDLIEYNVKENNIDFWIDKHQRFAARIAAEEVLRSSGYLTWSFRPRLLGTPDERITWIKNWWYRAPLWVRPFVYFFYRYFIRMGFLDGTNGLVYHVMHAFWFRLLIDVHISELGQRIKRGDCSLAELLRELGHPIQPP